MVYREWEIAQINEEQSLELQDKYKISTLLADIIVGRGGYSTSAEWMGNYTKWPSPFLMEDMQKAVDRIQIAIENGEKIVVFGDYDADGITATALLYSHLESTGANVIYRLPRRSEEGYGLSKSVVEEINEYGGQLIITVDSGVSSYDEVILANALSIDVIITDHHLPPEVLPPAIAVVNPSRKDGTFPEKKLSGVGVAFQLVCALEGCEPDELTEYYADLVAIGTIADIMPLKGLNRILVKQGLELLQETHRPGLEFLLEQSGYSQKQITAESISYGLAPRLNAAGRIGDATEALRLLITDDYEEAQEIAELLLQYNTERQQIECEIMKIAIEQIEADPSYKNEPVIIVWGEAFHQGVIGIVASRLVEKYEKPAVVISVENGEGKGSGRSVDNFSLHSAIVHCADLLIRYGGHELAAGLSIAEDNLQIFRDKINEYARKEWKHFSRKPIFIDVSASIKDMDVQSVKSLELLSPYGSGNPQPLFMLKNAVIDGVYSVQEGKHTRIRLKQDESSIYAILFGAEEKTIPYKQGERVDVVLALSVYTGQAGDSVSGRIKDIRPACAFIYDINSTWLYNSFSTGVFVTEKEKEELRPTREEAGQIYKKIIQGKFYLSDLRPLFALTEDITAGKILTAIDILLEIEVIEVEANTTILKKAEVVEKKNLEESKIFKSLL